MKTQAIQKGGRPASKPKQAPSPSEGAPTPMSAQTDELDPMQIPPRDSLTLAAKRQALNAIADYQEVHRCSLYDACLDLHLSPNDVKRWRKELGEHDAKRAVERAMNFVDEGGLPIHTAARRACCAERDLVRALKARGRRHYTTPHIRAHNRGSHTVAY